MRTRGEIEAAICEGVSRYMGRGPTDIRAYLLNDLLVVRVQGDPSHRAASRLSNKLQGHQQLRQQIGA